MAEREIISASAIIFHRHVVVLLLYCFCYVPVCVIEQLFIHLHDLTIRARQVLIFLRAALDQRAVFHVEHSVLELARLVAYNGYLSRVFIFIDQNLVLVYLNLHTVGPALLVNLTAAHHLRATHRCSLH